VLPPRSAAKTLQSHVVRLRDDLGRGAGSVIVTDGTGYRVEVQADGLDAARFERALNDGLDAQRAGDARQAVALLDEALSCWRDEAYLDFGDAAFAAAERMRLAELRALATETRTDAALRLGESATLVSELHARVAREPYRERAWEQLILALYRSGRQADALAAYQDARRQLRDEVGVAPAAPLQRLQQQILAADPDLAPPTPSGSITVSADRKIREHIPMPAQLPRDLSNFVGRDCELDQLNSLIIDDDADSEGSAVTAILGMPGVGKTALAVHWAHQIRDQFPDGQVYLDLRGHDLTEPAMDPAEALQAVLQAFGVPAQQIPSGLQARSALYRSLLSGQQVLIVLDGAHDAEQVRPLLPGSPGCRVILTSRDQLTSLAAIDGAQLLNLEPMSDSDAQALLTRRLGAQRIGAETAAVEQIVLACAGLPLALSVVAARVVPGFPLAVVANRLRAARGSLDAFDGGDETANLRSVLSGSYRYLSPPAARLFRLLPLLPGPDFASCVIAGLMGIQLPAVDSPLSELRRANLITEAKPGLFSLHELHRAFAGELSRSYDTDEERRRALRGLSEHCLHPAHRADRLLSQLGEDRGAWRATLSPITLDDLPPHREALDWFTAQHPGLRWALGPAANGGFEQGLRQLAWTFESFLEGNDYPRESRVAHRGRPEHDEQLHEPAGQAICHGCLAYAYGQLGRHPDAELHARQTLALYQEMDHRTGQLHAHRLLSWVLDRQGRYREALAQTQLAAELSGEHELDLPG